MKGEYKFILAKEVGCHSAIITVLYVLSFVFCFASCKKLVNVNTPDNRIAGSSVYSSDATATAVLTGLYTKLSSYSYGTSITLPTISMWAGLSADEFNLWTTASNAGVGPLAYYKNALFTGSSSSAGTEFWTNIYPLIYSCNAAIEGLNVSHALTPAVKQQLLGESKFMRAFFYFYLINLYGDAPLVLTTDYTINTSLARFPKGQVYQQIIVDLTDAQNLLNSNYVEADAITSRTNTERVRPNKYVATALLARVYLYTGDWVNAENQANILINNSSTFGLSSLNNTFLKYSLGNKEAIWQFQPVTTGIITNTAEAAAFILPYAPAGLGLSHPVYLSSALLNSFEMGDLRKVNGNWINVYADVTGTYYYPYKYKVAINGTNITPTEYNTIFRLGEQYLIRAEARAKQGNLSGATLDIDTIRHRAGLLSTTATTQSTILTAIMHERQVELFSEFGHRWLDLKRTGTVDAVMGTATVNKGGIWNTSQQLYPIPMSDLQKDPNLSQNVGY